MGPELILRNENDDDNNENKKKTMREEIKTRDI